MIINAKIIDAVIEDMESNDIVPSNRSQIRGTEKWERFHVAGDKSGSKNGTVLFKAGKYPSAVYGSFAKVEDYRHWHSVDREKLRSGEQRRLDRDHHNMQQAADAQQEVIYAQGR